MNRRSFLGTVGAVASAGLAGCFGRDGEQIRVAVLSAREATARVGIELRADGSTVFSQQLTVPPTSADEPITTTFDAGVADGTELIAEVTVDGDSTTAPFALECGSEFDGNLLTVKLQENGVFVSETTSGSSCY